MRSPHISIGSGLSRRASLRGAGVTLALPFLDAMRPAFGAAANRPEVLAELRGHEEKQFDALNGFLSALAAAHADGESLLDRTIVLYGTLMGSANSHSNVNLPVLLAGGGFCHGQHLAFDKENNYPLANLRLSMLQRPGIEAGSFSTSNGTMRGLETA